MRKRRRYADALNIAWRAVTRGDITWLEQRAGWGNGQVPASILLQLVRTVADANAAIAAAAGSAASVGAAAGSRGTSGDRIGLVFAEGEADLLAVHMYRRLRASALVSNDSDYLLCQVPRGLGEAPPAGAAAAGGAAAGGLAAAATAASAAATAATAATAAPSSDLVVVRSFDTRVGGELLRRDATAFTNVFNVAATQVRACVHAWHVVEHQAGARALLFLRPCSRYWYHFSHRLACHCARCLAGCHDCKHPRQGSDKHRRPQLHVWRVHPRISGQPPRRSVDLPRRWWWRAWQPLHQQQGRRQRCCRVSCHRLACRRAICVRVNRLVACASGQQRPRQSFVPRVQPKGARSSGRR